MYRGLVIAFLLALCAACRQPPAITYDGGVFEAHGWSGASPAAGWRGVFKVYAGNDPGSPPMTGVYERQGATILFRPAESPPPGVHLRAVFHRPGGEIASAVFNGPKAAVSSAPVQVTAAYPTTSEWPANQLKVHVEFSGPMTRGEAFHHLRLLDDKGQAIGGALLEAGPEIWNPDMTRLTVQFAPGLTAGRHYTLSVDRSWTAANGVMLAGDFRKSITAVAAVRETVDPGAWRISPPGTPIAPLVIQFPRSMDEVLALSLISVDGVEGQARLEDEERRWIFTPAHPWATGPHVLHIGGGLQDLAGNRLHQLYDAHAGDPAQGAAPAKFDRVTFMAP